MGLRLTRQARVDVDNVTYDVIIARRRMLWAVRRRWDNVGQSGIVIEDGKRSGGGHERANGVMQGYLPAGRACPKQKWTFFRGVGFSPA